MEKVLTMAKIKSLIDKVKMFLIKKIKNRKLIFFLNTVL